MRKNWINVVLVLSISLMCLTAMATRTPFIKDYDDRYTVVEKQVTVLEAGGRTVRAQYDFDTSGTLVSGASQSLTSVIPANAFVTSVKVVVDTTIISGSDNTLALSCETTGDMDAAVDLTSTAVDTPQDGIPDPSTGSTWVYTATGCTLTLDVGVGTTGVNGGKIIYLLEYMLKE